MIPLRITFLIALLLVVACSAPKSALLLDEEFSKISKDDFPDSLLQTVSNNVGIYGKGKVVVQHQKNSQRGNITFELSQENALFKLSNGFGIKGGWIFSDSEQVVQFNAVNRTKESFYKSELSDSDLAWLTINPFIFVNPQWGMNPPFRYFSSVSYYRISDRSGNELVWDKNSKLPLKRFLSIEGIDWTIDYDLWRSLQNETIPGRIQCISEAASSSIFMLIQQFTVQSDPNISIPEQL